MANNTESFSKNMTRLIMDIVASLGQIPEEQREYLFGLEGDEDMDFVFMFACYITMEYIKYSFDYNDPVYSLRHFIKDENDSDDERMKWSRVLAYVSKYKRREIEILGIELPPDHKFADLDMRDIKRKLQGYRLTEMNFFEIQKVYDLELIKSIVENRISSSKKIPVPRFKDIFREYDDFMQELTARATKSDMDMVFSSIAFFTFQWHYPIETFYYIACLMEKNDIKEVNASDAVLLCGNIEVESIFYGWVSVQSRMVKERIIFLDYLFDEDRNPFDKEELVQTIKELVALATDYKYSKTCIDGRKYIDWFRTESSMEDWASFFRRYDIFALWKQKEWTPKRIQNMRKLFEITTMEKL